MDVWLLVVNVESNGERNRVFHILKSRGMAHSNQMREFLITDSGIDLVDAYIGPGGVLTGSARLQQEAQEKAAALAAQEELERRRRVLHRKRQIMEAQVAALQAEISAEEEELQALKDKSEAPAKNCRRGKRAAGCGPQSRCPGVQRGRINRCPKKKIMNCGSTWRE